MSGLKSSIAVAVVLGTAIVATGCVQMPTEKRSVADMRPQISFKADGEKARAGRVIVDGLDMGAVGDYLDGFAAVRVLPGSHVLKVMSGDAVLLDEKIYLGDGVNRSFIIK
ncbi:MAG: hypothetical protein KJ787_03465 [Gammaproteobacteria bacterium]|nr:hypothetical protein [Gammaproteobacteria bacterium]MBU1645370.1 hypothetical protein [Gammaproteobacteria bacterium]MBU1972363.1 hypothetical protein [Gammaproteobacteria bacterium]